MNVTAQSRFIIKRQLGQGSFSNEKKELIEFPQNFQGLSNF